MDIDNTVTILPDTEDNQKILDKLFKIWIIDAKTEVCIAKFASSDYKTADKIARAFYEKYLEEDFPDAYMMNKSPHIDVQYAKMPFTIVDTEKPAIYDAVFKSSDNVILPEIRNQCLAFIYNGNNQQTIDNNNSPEDR